METQTHFIYIGYAESRDLFNWVVINGIDNPIVSVAPLTMAINAEGVPAAPGQPSTQITPPAEAPVAGSTTHPQKLAGWRKEKAAWCRAAGESKLVQQTAIEGLLLCGVAIAVVAKPKNHVRKITHEGNNLIDFCVGLDVASHLT